MPRNPLIDPTASEAADAIDEAFKTASEEEATLVLALIGHGILSDGDFYFLPRDGSEHSLRKTGIHLAQLIKTVLGAPDITRPFQGSRMVDASCSSYG